MGSCISTKEGRTSRKTLLTEKKNNCRNAPADKCVPNKTKTTISKSALSFIYIPTEQVADIADFTADLIIKRTSTKAHCSDFCNIYRNSDIVDKKLFLNSAFLVSEVSSPSVDTASGLISPIECEQYRKVVEGTFLLSPDIMTSPALLTSSSLPTTPALVDSQMTTWGKHISRNNTVTQDSQRTTFISEENTVFSFEDDAIESLQRIFSSSFKQDFLEMF